ncbi:amidohydrolase family protein [Methylobacterium sp. D54C]
MMNRRGLLSGLSATGAGALLTSCQSIGPIAFCPEDPLISDPLTPLTIDIHTHVFNGSDLQVSAFLQDVVAPDNEAARSLGPLLQELAWTLAPSGRDEIARLEQVSAALRACGTGRSISDLVAADGQQQYEKGVIALQTAKRALVGRSRALRGERISSGLLQEIDKLPPTFVEFKRTYRGGNRARDFAINPQGAMDFIIQNFQYRYVTTFDYLQEYSTGRDRKIDLMIAHLVDYDWPLGQSAGTITSFPDQFAVMERISILTGGRIHYFAPFCPFRESAFRLGLSTTSSLALVKEAIGRRGAVGVKLYPPMGFAPLGNARKENEGTWTGSVPLDSRLQRADIGQLLDESLASLYEWCRAEQVPIMAHTSPTNLASANYEKLLDARWWELALNTYRGLQINFGHFGQTNPSESADSLTREMQFASLMSAAPGSPGQFAFADSAYFADILSQPVALRENLRTIFRRTAGKGNAALAQRLMYGTDWEIVLIEGTAQKAYLSKFQAVINELSKDPNLGVTGRLSENFFGRNAARFLGLSKGAGGSRSRIDALYAGQGVPIPNWMKKVDALAMSST